ncbi:MULTISPECIES: Dps family protein [unclassified Streptomyces]|uniref:Dps family protein n=1 Tax=unclassified Streptomyces TaxID=2593676 RepID=UPI002E2DFD99|nr:DNA starvation/stationary phase protection protein [Streptomyces sp. NBC_01429]
MSSQNDPQYTVPGMTASEGGETVQSLRMRLHALNDLALTLKHVHWNVVGPHFIAVHEMLDPQVDAVRGMVDETAERISTLGGSPAGTPGALVRERGWDDYAVGRAEAIEHLGALDLVYSGIIADHRQTAVSVGKLDPVTQDMLIQHLRSLELFQWFIRAHLESAGGRLSTRGGTTETDAAAAAGKQVLHRP